MISAVAEALADAAQGVDVGAVNCAKNPGVCGRADIREYPSYRLAAGGAPQTSDNGPVQIQTFGGASVVTPGQAAPVQTQAPAAPAVAPVIIM
jgi:hypothetical protein